MLNLPLSSRADFVPLPSDPSIPLTPEQEKALFRGDVERVARLIYQGILADLLAAQHTQHTTSADGACEKAAQNAR